eukprot:15209595-Alexandrium_andersonii.AAC.1
MPKTSTRGMRSPVFPRAGNSHETQVLPRVTLTRAPAPLLAGASRRSGREGHVLPRVTLPAARLS